MEEFDIPTTANFYGKPCRITEFGDGAFANCSNLSSITIPQGITTT